MKLTARARDKAATRPDKIGLVSRGSPEADQVRRAYVAMTRPTERLIVTCHRESAFVKRLLAAGARAD